MKYSEFEAKFKPFLYRFLKERTGAFLDIVDNSLANDSISVGTARMLENIKTRGKKQFMELQDTILAGAKCIHETGEAPQGIDRRASKVQGGSDESPD